MPKTPSVSNRKVGNYLKDRLGINIFKDPYQQAYVDAMLKPTKEVQAVFLDAEAGTGKTSLAISVAYFLLEQELIDQIVYVRNAVSIRELGFLPGDIAEKEAPYMQPGLDALSRIDKKNPKLIETLINNEQLVVTTTAFLRGVDWDERKFLIVDEAQNLSLEELQMVLTRPHDSTKVVVIGSSIQCDVPTARRYGLDHILAFELYSYHFTEISDLNVLSLELVTNYRGKFSLIADKVGKTIEYLNTMPSERKGKPALIEEKTLEEESEAWENVANMFTK